MNIKEWLYHVLGAKKEIEDIRQVNSFLRKRNEECSNANEKLFVDLHKKDSFIFETEKKISELQQYTYLYHTDMDEYAKKYALKQTDNKAYKNKRTYQDKPYSVYINEMITPENFEVLKFKRSFLNMAGDKRETISKLGVVVSKKIKWESDENLANSEDYYILPSEIITSRTGDCIAEYENIVTLEGIKKAKDIKLGEIVLSYNFEKEKYEWKPIINLWNKGKKSIKRVHFRNGSHIDVTEEHHMLIRTNAKKHTYEKKDLKDVDFESSYWKKIVPCSLKLPYKIKDDINITEDHCFVIGHFLAEGWCENGRVCTSGYDVYPEIVDRLEKLQIPFSEKANANGVPVITFLKSDFKELLKSLKKNSFEFELSEKLISLPEKKIQRILEGFFLGDGHISRCSVNPKKEFENYSVSCEAFAKQIRLLSLRIGKPIHFWKQTEHKGLGKKPIWRLRYNPYSQFCQEHSNGMSEVSISFIEDVGIAQTYDWEVQDNHNFFFENGICTAQCEDHAFLCSSILPFWIGIEYGHAPFGWHAWNVAVFDGEKYILDTTADALFLEKSADTKYKPYYLVTPKYTYTYDSSVEFGEIAGWR